MKKIVTGLFCLAIGLVSAVGVATAIDQSVPNVLHRECQPAYAVAGDCDLWTRNLTGWHLIGFTGAIVGGVLLAITGIGLLLSKALEI